MSYEIKEEENGTKITTRYFGLLTTAELNESFKKRLSDINKVKKYKILLSDFTDVMETDFYGLDVIYLAKMYKKAALQNADVIAVAVVPGNLLFGLGRMWEGYIYGIQWEEKIVRTREEAQSFIDSHLKN